MVNGHTPVKGESPIRGGGLLFVIDMVASVRSRRKLERPAIHAQ